MYVSREEHGAAITNHEWVQCNTRLYDHRPGLILSMITTVSPSESVRDQMTNAMKLREAIVEIDQATNMSHDPLYSILSTRANSVLLLNNPWGIIC